MMRPLRAAQIGAGSFCEQFHAPVLKRLAEEPAPRVSLAGICDLNLHRAQMFSRQFGYAHAYQDFRQMIEEVQPDLLYCMVQPTATASVVAEVLPLGLPIFTEKPPGVTVAQADRLAALARDYKVLSYVAFNRRAVPGLQRLRQWACENQPVRYARAEMFRNQRLEPEFAIATAIHALDTLRFLCGEIVEVETRCNPYPACSARDFHIQLTCESGASAELAVLVDCGVTRERYLLQVQNQTMEVTLAASYSSPFCHDGERLYRDNALVRDEPCDQDPLVAGGFVGEHNLFLDAVAFGKPSACTLQDARHSLMLAVALHQGYSGPIHKFAPRTSE